MPVVTQCPKCEKKLQAPDERVGEQAKCPQCGHPFTVKPFTGAASGSETEIAQSATPSPSSRKQDQPLVQSQPVGRPPPDAEAVVRWYVQTPDGTEYGPVDKSELDEWCAEDRLDGECRVLQEGWTQWKWAEDVYPQLAVAASSGTDNPLAGVGEQIVAPKTSPIIDISAESKPTAASQSFDPATTSTGYEETIGAVPAEVQTVLSDTRPWVLGLAIFSFIDAILGSYLFR